jgi:hypothetical protein
MDGKVNQPMNHPQIYFYPHTIQNEFPYQIGNLCQISFQTHEFSHSNKYKQIYTELEAFLLGSEPYVESETITIDFKDAVSKKYIQYKLEGLKKVFDWLSKQWSFGMKKLNSLTITYGRYPLIKILFSYDDDDSDDNGNDSDDDGYGNRYDMDENAVCDEEPLHNSYLDLYDFEKYWNKMNPNIPITHGVLQGGKYIKKEIEKDLYEKDDYIRSLVNPEKINSFLEENKKRPYALAHLWNRYWYEGVYGFVLRKLFDRPLLTRQILFLENGGEVMDTEIKTPWAVKINIAIGLAGTVGLSYIWIKNIFEFEK